MFQLVNQLVNQPMHWVMCFANARHQLLGIMVKVRCPVRLVTGEADVVYLEHAELVMQKLSATSRHVTKCVTMPRVGHAVSCENPELAASIMLDFVRHLEVD